MNGAILNIHETDSMEDGFLKRLRAQVTDVEVCSYSLKVGRFTAKACRQTPWSLGWIQRRGWGSGHGPFLVQTPFPGRCLGRVPVSVCDGLTAAAWHWLDPDTHSYTPNCFSILTQNFILPWETLSHLKASPFSFNHLYPKMCLISITLFCTPNGSFLSYFLWSLEKIFSWQSDYVLVKIKTIYETQTKYV